MAVYVVVKRHPWDNWLQAKESKMLLSPNVNTDVKMTQKMMHALNRHEAICRCLRVKAVTDQAVKKFLSDEYGQEFAEKFRPEYLFSSPESATHPQ